MTKAQNAKAAQKERTHETILESASRLLRERGISGARVADVMQGAGLTVGGFYAHFASKEALIDEAIRRTGERMRAALFRRLQDIPESVRGEVVIKRYLSARHRDSVAEGCPLPAVVGEVGTTAPEHHEALAGELGRFAEDFEPHLPSREGFSRKRLGLGLIALMYGGLTLARAVRGTELSDEILRACREVGRLVARPSRRDA